MRHSTICSVFRISVVATLSSIDGDLCVRTSTSELTKIADSSGGSPTWTTRRAIQVYV